MTSADRSRYRPLILLVIALILRVAVPGGSNFSYIFLAIYAMTSIQGAVHAVFISWLFTVATIGEQASIAVVARFGIIFIAAFSVFLHFIAERRKLKIRTPLVLVFLLLVFVLIHSVFFSGYPGVSILKVFMWGVTYITLMIAWSCLRVEEYLRLENELFIALGGIVFLSLPFMASSVGYLAGVGFKGMMGQPQAFGVMLSVTAAWAMARMVSSQKFSWFSTIVLGLSLLMILKSGCRTGGFALCLGMFIAIFIKLISSRSLLHKFRAQLVLKRIAILVLVSAPFVAVAATTLQRYVQKGTEADDVTELYMTSRGSLLDPMLTNIKRYPFSGIGFGIASNIDSMKVFYDPYFNLPINAVVEKGVLPVAALEEIGIPGFALFLGLFFSFVWVAARNSFIHLSVLATCFCTNLAEYTFFSIGGMGMLLALLIAWCVSKPLPPLPPKVGPRRPPRPGEPIPA